MTGIILWIGAAAVHWEMRSRCSRQSLDLAVVRREELAPSPITS